MQVCLKEKKNLRVHMRTQTYVCTYAHSSVYACRYAWRGENILFVCMRTQPCLCVYAHTFTCVHICAKVCLNGRKKFARTCVLRHKCVYMRTHLHVYVCSRRYAWTGEHILCVYMRTQPYVCVYAHSSTCVCICVQVCLKGRKHSPYTTLPTGNFSKSETMSGQLHLFGLFFSPSEKEKKCSCDFQVNEFVVSTCMNECCHNESCVMSHL